MTVMVEHDCPVEGPMKVEADKPCNWCGRTEESDRPETPNAR